MNGRIPTPDHRGDFRDRATFWVTLAALILLLPFTFLSAAREQYVIAIGTGGIVTMLALNTVLVTSGRDHERVTLYVLVPGGMLFMTNVFAANAFIGVLWCFPAVLGVYCMLSCRRAVIANGIILSIALPMSWQTLEPALAARVVATLMAVSVFAAILVREIDAMRARLRHEIEHDPLTGLRNRTSLRRCLDRLTRKRPGRPPAALLAVDLDHFKSINDLHGHEAGDRVLEAVARLLRAHARAGDAVFRLGGEEFLLVLDGTGRSDAGLRAERLRVDIERMDILAQRTVTASIGVAVRRADDDRDTWSRRADERLYIAKGAGRNRIETGRDASVSRRQCSSAGEVPAEESHLPEGEERRAGTSTVSTP